MNTLVQMFVASFVSIALSVAVLLVLSSPLMNILRRLCPDEAAASFWLSYTKLMLTISPLLLVLIADMFAHFSNPLDSVRLALMAALAGLLAGLYLIGKRLVQFVKTKPGSTP
ncbi:MAG: hypothetical protein FWD77_09390 [Betaproteobacteria bacterium]|nr:hypothetical protein [Betaproteobacteria bacterium]